MKVAEIHGGIPATLRIRATTGQFQSVPPRGDEVALVRSGDHTLLAHGDVASAVEGLTPADSTELADVVLSGLPVLAYVAQARPSVVVVETRRFTLELRVPESMQLGLDEKVMDDIRRGHRVDGTAADVAAWLEVRLFLPPAPGGKPEFRRVVLSGDPRGRVGAFRIHGDGVAADVRRVDETLRIERVVRGGRGSNPRLVLLHAPISIVDATLAAKVHGAVRTTLSEVVARSESYLRLWQDYLKRERESVLRRARIFGALEYRRCERRRDGGWRFQLAEIDDLAARLGILGDRDRFELEVGEQPPKLEGDLGAEPKKQTGHQDRLRAPVVDMNAQQGVVDLAGPDDEDEQPSPPEAGYLFLATGGDDTRLRRRERAEEALRTGNCPLPQLGLLMEGRPAPAARRARISVEGPTLKPVIREVFAPARPTPRQLEAIEIALNTPDVCLIQGPPGTGKTKVITAIERCLAVLADEGVEPSHRILVAAAQHDAVENVVQRTEVFGLPAVKVGRRRRGSDSGVDPAQLFADERVEQLRARLRVTPEAERLSRARGIVLACVRTRSLPADQARRIRDLVKTIEDLLPPQLRDKALERAAALERPENAGDPEEAELLTRAARGIRVEEGPFSDDGPVRARVALQRLGTLLAPDERSFLERCAAVEPDTVPPWLAEGRPLRDALVDRLTRPAPVAEPRLDDATQQLLLLILDTVDRRLAATRAGEEAAIASYVDDLVTDPLAVRKALEHYTVVLASTLQQAAGNVMRRVRGIEEGQNTFESVMIDEAARAHPLDLFIPLSMARRRVVLVGDHRQLPHLLEPDVERQLAEAVHEGTVEKQTLEAVKASLFERMWKLLRTLEEKDEIPRTVTLNVQYRMHPELGSFLSREFYEFRHDSPIESERPADQFAHTLPGYLTKSGLASAAAWIDVPATRGREVRGVSKSRPAEARVIAKELRRLIDHDPKLTFGVIAFYSEQVDEIGRAMIEEGLTEPANNDRGWKIADEWATTFGVGSKRLVERLRIGTVDAFQGKEFDVVFLSVTRSNDLPGETDEEQRRKYGHLMLENRLCVGMSRQQRLLVAVGDLAFVRAAVAAVPLRALRGFADLCRGPHGVVR
ncbi:MAG TPA: AAA domain-containing protein [Planctomycetota bacterium]|nr:AAA domain-containing protein [Planctomycetota bacterium]